MRTSRHDKSQTKIIATIGPATSSKEVLRELFLEGIDVCRLNFSHGKHEDHAKVIQIILELNKELGCNVAMLADLQGPKLRVGEVEEGTMLEEGAELTFVNEKCLGNAQKVYMSYKEFPNDVAVGDFILIDDGKLKLEATYTNRKDTVKAKVIHGGKLSSKKGVNLPSTKISLPSLTEKDIADAEFALDQNVDWLALSFVRSATDVLDLKEIIKKKKKHARIIAKIEKPEALKEIDNIIDMADGIMVARGDLGVEVPFDRVPIIQKELVKKCSAFAKPVIIATQMMESMITNFRPTRAEATDVANAVLDGADALMLSGETSVGAFPALVIKSMQEIIDYTESNGFVFDRLEMPDDFSRTFFPDSTCHTACSMASQTKARAIVALTYSGYTAYRISAHRPNADIFAFTSNKNILRQLSLLWGVRAYYFDDKKDINEAIEASITMLKEKGLVKEDERVVHVGSIPMKKRGQTNMLKLSIV